MVDVKVGKWVLAIPDDCDGLALVDHFLLAVRRSRKNPMYYYYHEKYEDPFSFVNDEPRQLIKYLRSINPCVVITKSGKILLAEVVKDYFYYSTTPYFSPNAPKFYLLKIKDEG